MFWQYFTAILDKHVNADESISLPRTITPLAGLHQRSALEISMVPLLLAEDAGSLLRAVPGRHTVLAVGQFSHDGITFYRVYLSNDPGTFLHLAVATTNPQRMIECRLYQPYIEADIPYATVAETTQFNVGEDQSWEFWLNNDPDPNVGGMIGCPSILGKNSDGGILYYRTWVQGNPSRIFPLLMNETLIDAVGGTNSTQHQMMHYGRALENALSEYLLVSAVQQTDGRGSLNMWLGIDIDVSDLTIYPSAR